MMASAVSNSELERKSGSGQTKAQKWEKSCLVQDGDSESGNTERLSLRKGLIRIENASANFVLTLEAVLIYQDENHDRGEGALRRPGRLKSITAA
jgi:hypothetical protein